MEIRPPPVTVGVNAILIKKLVQFVTLDNILTKSWECGIP